MGVYAYKLDADTREGLLAEIPPAYAEVIADHVVFKTGEKGESMPELHKAEIIGMVNNGKGLQVAVVSINGSVERPDGKIYHIIWSKAPDVAPEIDYTFLAETVKEWGITA